MDESTDKSISYDIEAAKDDLTDLYSKIDRFDLLTKKDIIPIYVNIPELITQWLNSFDSCRKACMAMVYN